MARIEKFSGKTKAPKDNPLAQIFEMILDKCDEIIVQVNNHDTEFTKLNLQFAQIRLDLKSAMILHDEPYTPPPVDELAPGAKAGSRKDSKKVTKFKKEDPF